MALNVLGQGLLLSSPLKLHRAMDSLNCNLEDGQEGSGPNRGREVQMCLRHQGEAAPLPITGVLLAQAGRRAGGCQAFRCVQSSIVSFRGVACVES